MNKISFFLLCFLFLQGAATAQKTVLGTWKMVNESTHDVNYHVQIFQFEGRVYGKVVKIVKGEIDERCTLCPGDLKNQSTLGMVVMERMQYQNGFFRNGKVLDPTNGKWYSCQMWLKDEDPDILVVRGFLGFLYRTQYWVRVE